MEGFSMSVYKGFCNLAVIFAVAAIMLFSTGCEQQAVSGGEFNINQEAISLYVDAMMLEEINEQEQAIKKLDAAVEIFPEFALAYSYKGDIHKSAGRYDQSADAYEAATQVDQWSFKDFFNLGKMAQILEQFARAVKAYVSAADIEPEHYGAHVGAAKCYYHLEDYDMALQYGNRAREINPDMAAAEAIIADVYAARDQQAEAIDGYRRALEIEGNNPKVMVSLAIAYLKTERFAAAKELLDSSIEIDPSNPVAYQYLGFVQLKLSQPAEAIASYKKAIDLDAGDWMAYKGIGVVYMLQSVQNNSEQLKAIGIGHWRTSLRIHPDQPKLEALLQKYSAD